MPLQAEVLQGHIQKKQNFPSSLLKSIPRGDPPYLCDLHGYTCAAARELMQTAFKHPLPQRAIYTFTLGRGKHSVKQYRIELGKACHEGLRAARLTEDRHASDGACGVFKSIDDKDHGMHTVRVFPFHSCPQTVPAEMTSGPVDADIEAQVAVQAVCDTCCPGELKRLSVLGLCEVMMDMLTVIVEGGRGDRELKKGLVPSPFGLHAADALERVREAWKTSLDLLRHFLVAPCEVTRDERSMVFQLLDNMTEAQAKSTPSAAETELRALAEASFVRKNLEEREPDAVVLKWEREFKHLEEKLRLWNESRHTFESHSEPQRATKRALELKEKIAEYYQEVHLASRLRDGHVRARTECKGGSARPFESPSLRKKERPAMKAANSVSASQRSSFVYPSIVSRPRLAPSKSNASLHVAGGDRTDSCQARETSVRTQVHEAQQERLPTTNLQSLLDVTTWDVFPVMHTYSAEAQGYVSVKSGDTVAVAPLGEYPADPGCKYEEYVYAARFSDGAYGWLPSEVLWEHIA
eukprot:TRINITY_DN17963_c0_g1_i1.p1 TRINITY_DN17963_c0_g1~~TRINITY_DN17963_c0_g1_i1.p1  ORF type:complete len:523 (-),score=59.30 TRINITY_DN17963_c0_g1_i1:310-1878(-)